MTSDDGATGVSHVQPGGNARLSTRKVEATFFCRFHAPTW
jgi:hypothetical protein